MNPRLMKSTKSKLIQLYFNTYFEIRTHSNTTLNKSRLHNTNKICQKQTYITIFQHYRIKTNLNIALHESQPNNTNEIRQKRTHITIFQHHEIKMNSNTTLHESLPTTPTKSAKSKHT